MTTTKHITRTTRDLGQQVQIVLVTNTSSIRPFSNLMLSHSSPRCSIVGTRKTRHVGKTARAVEFVCLRDEL